MAKEKTVAKQQTYLCRYKLILNYLLIITFILRTTSACGNSPIRTYRGEDVENEIEISQVDNIQNGAGISQEEEEHQALDSDSDKETTGENYPEKELFKGQLIKTQLIKAQPIKTGSHSIHNTIPEGDSIISTTGTINEKKRYSSAEYEYEMEKLREMGQRRGVVNNNIPLALENMLLEARERVNYTQDTPIPPEGRR